MSPLRWTTKSLRHLAEELTRRGHPVSAPTVGRLLQREGFSLQANVKTLKGAQHPDRDGQFRYVNEQVKEHQADGEPVISVDTKKREQLGCLPMAGREWRPTGEPVEVEDHHCFFTGPDVEQAIPYGIYDLTRNTGWVNVGVDHDTCVFAVESIRRWWRARGSRDYPKASRLLITADAGGSNGYRYRVWKSWLATLAAETGPAITVCHFPPGPPRGTRSNTGCSRTSPKLAGQATDQPRGGRQDHRGDPHQQRSACRGRPGSRRLPDGSRDQQAAPGCPAA